MTVFLPPPDNNPYLKLLMAALQQFQTTVRLMPVVLSEQWLDSVPRSGRMVLHFHWPSYGYTDESRPQMAEYVREWARTLGTAKRLGFKIVWTAHNLYPHEQLHRDLEQEARQILLDACDAVIVHCQAGIGLLQKHFRVKARYAVIPHGHYAGIYGAPVEALEARQKLGIHKEGTVYLFFGQLRPYKGLRKLLQVFAGLPADTGTLVIAGATMNAGFTRRLIEESRCHGNIVVHPFFIPDHEVCLYLSAADVIVLPYTDVLTSGSAVLAHSLGRPVIAPAIGCLSDTVAEGTGWLYEAEAENGLSEALKAARGPLEAARSERCLRAALENNWRMVGEKTSGVYAQCFDATPNT